MGRRLALMLLAGCGRLGFDPTGGGVTIDGAPATDGGLDGTTAACLAPGNASTFPGGLPCASWSANAQFTNTGVSESNGALTITPNANSAGAQGGCFRTGVPFGPAGAIVEVGQVLTGANAITAIQLGTGDDAMTVVVQNGMLVAQDASGTLEVVAYNAAAMRFWRIRPGIFDYSDGATWTPLATTAQAAPASYDIRLVAGTLTGVAMPGTARFESVNLCP